MVLVVVLRHILTLLPELTFDLLYIVKASSELLILLPLLFECWDYRHVLTHPMSHSIDCPCIPCTKPWAPSPAPQETEHDSV